MILVDANLLLYAYNPSTPQHEVARDWLEGTFGGSERVGLPWVTLLAFLRIGTNARAFPQPLSMKEAADIVATWLAHDLVMVVQPTERHWEILMPLMSKARARGPLVTDAHLAALAIEHGALLCSSDTDFAKFPGLRWHDPLAL